MDDLFSVPLGYVDPDQGPDNELSLPAIPPEAFEHPGKWVAFRGAGLDMIRDTQEELLEALGGRRLGVILFHVPTSRIFARRAGASVARRRFLYDAYDVPSLDVRLQAQGCPPADLLGTVEEGASTTVLSVEDAEQFGLQPSGERLSGALAALMVAQTLAWLAARALPSA